MEYKLGRNRETPDTSVQLIQPKGFGLTALPKTPPSRMWLPAIDYGAMGNDLIGDCCAAFVGHAIQVFTYNTNRFYTPSDKSVIDFYRYSGYDPSQPATDFGWTLGGALGRYKKNGIDGHTCQATAYVNPLNIPLIKTAINMYGVVDLGLGLPVTAYYQLHGIWDVSPNVSDPNAVPWSWGGHSMLGGGYDDQFLYGVTWGFLQKMTWAFVKKYVTDVYAVLSKDCKINANKSFTGHAYDVLVNQISHRN